MMSCLATASWCFCVFHWLIQYNSVSYMPSGIKSFWVLSCGTSAVNHCVVRQRDVHVDVAQEMLWCWDVLLLFQWNWMWMWMWHNQCNSELNQCNAMLLWCDALLCCYQSYFHFTLKYTQWNILIHFKYKCETIKVMHSIKDIQ